MHGLLAVHSYARLAGKLPVHKLLQQLPLSTSQGQVPSQEFMLRASTNTIVLDGLAPHAADNDLLGTPGLLMATSSWVFSRLIFARLYCHSRLTDQQSANSRVQLTNAVWHRNQGLLKFFVWKIVSCTMWHWRTSTATEAKGGWVLGWARELHVGILKRKKFNWWVLKGWATAFPCNFSYKESNFTH